MLTAIRQWVIKTMMKGNTGVVQSLPKQEIIEMNVQITAQRMMQNGINPNDMKTVGQVENVVNQIEQPKVNVNSGVTGVKKAEVFDIDGNKIPEGSKIMGGKKVESDAAIKARLDADNKKGIAGIKNKPLDPNDVLPDSVYNETPGAFTRRNTPGSKENLLQELKIAYEKDFNKLRGNETVEELQKILKDLDTNGEPFADGGRIGLLAGSVPKLLRLLKNKKKVNQAVNDIFPTGDYKYDAQMAADSLVENNPQTFGGKLYDDLDMDTQMEVYGAVIGPIQSNALAVSKMKKATRPEKTLASMNEGKGINMSDPDIADEFARFMKETDPKGTKELEQKLELENFKTKDRSENAYGGRIGYSKGNIVKGIISLFKKKPKKLENTVNEFIEKRKFLKSMVGETEKNKKARELKMLKEAMEEARENPGFKFENVDVDKDIRPIFDKEIAESLKKDRKLNADGGRIGLKGGYLASGAKQLGKKYKGSTLSALLENPKLLGAELGHDGITAIMNLLPNLYADGGRIGLKGGMTKRAFMKLMGSTAAGIGAAKSGIFSGFGKGAGKTVAKEVAQQTTSSMPPPYFFKLAEKIKNMGNDVTSTSERTITKSLKAKDGNAEYILEQDMVSGDTLIKKVNKEGDDMITDVQIMEYRMGENVPTRDGRVVTSPNEYEEVTEVNKRIYKDDYNASDYTDGIEEIELKKIIDEVDDQAPSIKYASGGLAYMLGE